LKQIGNELIGNGNNGNQEQDDAREREEVLKGAPTLSIRISIEG